MTVDSETQYSIYKINFEAVENTFSSVSHGSNNAEYAENIIDVLINSTTKIIKDKHKSLIYAISYQGLRGVIFKTTHYPSWGGVANQIISNNEAQSQKIDENFLTNTNVSYVYFYLCDNKVFAVTGGYGAITFQNLLKKISGCIFFRKL